MASSLPPPGASRPPPPLAPPALAESPSPTPRLAEPQPQPQPRVKPPPDALAQRGATTTGEPPPVALFDDAADGTHQRWGAARWILLVGFGLVAVALGVIANQAWLMGIETSWVWWSSIAVVPPALAALAALFGWRHTAALAIAASAWTTVVALVGLARQPPLGLPQAVCAIAAVSVTVAARAAASGRRRAATPRVSLAEHAS